MTYVRRWIVAVIREPGLVPECLSELVAVHTDLERPILPTFVFKLKGILTYSRLRALSTI